MGKRDLYRIEQDLERYRKRYQTHLFPTLENTPDLSRGQTRLAAEVALAVIRGVAIPSDQVHAFEAARLNAFETLSILAKG